MIWKRENYTFDGCPMPKKPEIESSDSELEYNIELEKCLKKRKEIYERFKKDAIENAGLTGHPKAEKAFYFIVRRHPAENRSVIIWKELLELANEVIL